MKITENKSARTFTIRVNDKDYKCKYRTTKMTKKQFESACYWTVGDWKQFLKTDDYYLVN